MKPSQWCEKEYSCPVATTAVPGQFFFWLLKLYKLRKSGYTIDNNDLPLDTWLSLGEIADAIESTKEKDTMMAMGHQMYTSIISGLNKRTAQPTRR